MSLGKRLFAEMMGTAILVIGGCGTAVLATGAGGVGTLGVALAFGFSLVAMAYAIGGISGCHINPAVTLGLVAAGKFCPKDAVGYVVAQVVGALLGAGAIYMIATGKAGFDVHAAFATNGFGEHSPGGYSQKAVFIAEAVLTFIFLFVILNVLRHEHLASFAPLPVGITLALIHLISIPVDNTSVNPARSTGVAIFQGGWAMDQLWLFWAAPILGAVVAGVLHRCCCHSSCSTTSGSCSTGKTSCSN